MEHMTEEKAYAKLVDDCYDCAQTVFSHFAEELGLDEETALKISAGFGGGMHKGDMCGTVTGGLMALGLVHVAEVDDAAASLNFIPAPGERPVEDRISLTLL